MKEQTTSKQSFKGVRNALITTAILGSLVVGDVYQPITSLQENVKYHNLSVEDGFPTDYKDLGVIINVNERNRAEVYFGNVETRTLHPVNTNYHTKRDIGVQIDTTLSNTYLSIKDFFKGGAKDTVSKNDTTDSFFETQWNRFKTYMDEKVFD